MDVVIHVFICFVVIVFNKDNHVKKLNFLAFIIVLCWFEIRKNQ